MRHRVRQICIFIPRGRKCISDLTTLTIKHGTVTKLNSRASYSPFAASWEKTATVNQFYNGLSSFPEIDFSPLLQLLALAYTTPRAPHTPAVTFMSWPRVEFPARVVNRIIKMSEPSYVGTPQPFCAPVLARWNCDSAGENNEGWHSSKKNEKRREGEGERAE